MKKKDYASYYVEQKKSDRYCDPFFILKLKKKLFFFFRGTNLLTRPILLRARNLI